MKIKRRRIMEQSKDIRGLYDDWGSKATGPCVEVARKDEVFRVIDDGTCVLTTLNPYKALRAINEVMDKHEITACWVDFEDLR
jgi:hypothetical protein